MKYFLLLISAGILLTACTQTRESGRLSFGESIDIATLDNSFIQVKLKEIETKVRLPQLQSFAFAEYNDLWIFIGGMKSGFHGTSFNPPPFRASKVNDSIWVVDLKSQQMWATAVPQAYKPYLSATNPNFFQLGDLLYFCGGYAAKDASSLTLNYTSDNLFEINLPNLVQWVVSGNPGFPLDQVFTKQVQSPYLKVTGGELVIVNNNFYLIGGQNFDGPYSPGTSGIYTNAIRKFNLANVGGVWTVQDTLSVTDAVNLHRRDMNVVPTLVQDVDSIRYTLLGGVFTPKDEAYLNPVFISGLQTGQPKISVSPYEQQVNQYTCAYIPFISGSKSYNMTVLIGGISYKMYDEKSQQLVIGDNGIPMPFSNLVSYILTDGTQLVEDIQLPPYRGLLQKYIGSNAQFIPNKEYLYGGQLGLLNLAKVISTAGSEVLVGYMIGGILSEGPTSGTTPHGYVSTYVNPALYGVYVQTGNSQTASGQE